MQIETTTYNDDWPKEYEGARDVLLGFFRDDIQAVEHIGSTAVPGLNAKPVIDMFLGVAPFRDVSFYEEVLKNQHYRYVHTNMHNRYLFSKYAYRNVWTHNLHILPFDEGFYLRNEILFRDYLRRDPVLVRKYNDLKKDLVKMEFSSLEEYTRAKTTFIQSVVDLARLEKGLPRQDVWTLQYL